MDWQRPRYWCTNVAGRCPVALADTPHSQQRFQELNGRCGGAKVGAGCGQPLVAGVPIDLRSRWTARALAAVTAAVLAVWLSQAVLFPPPLEKIGFATAETRTDDGSGTLTIELRREAPLEHRAEVRCELIDGSAKAGEDFTEMTRRVVFEPGERSKAIAVTLLPDRSQQKSTRYFSVMLPNVKGEPKHVVFIAPKPVDRSQALQAEQMVMQMSRIAADIASFAVKRQVLDSLMTASRDKPEFGAYKTQLADVEGNLVRAREAYAQSMRELQTHQAALVLNTMDRLRDDLLTRSFQQQSRAMGVAKQQFTELLQHQSMDLDRWVQELAKIVPVPNSGAKAQTSI